MAIPVITACSIPTSDGVFCGVTIEPYCLCRRGDQPITIEDVPEEGATDGGIYQLRSRWYRSNLPRAGTFCSVHPDKEATLQCIVCVKCRVAHHLSYHCSPECLKSHWHIHRDYHKQLLNGEYNPQDNGAAAYQSSTDNSWVEVGRQRYYTPTQEDIGFQLKFEMSIVDRTRPNAPEVSKVSPQPTQRVRPTPTPPARQMVQLVPHNSHYYPGSRFTVLSYNLLADLYAKADFAKTCPPWSLAWNYRKRNLLREMLNYKADILCLQEVQSNHYTDFWAPELQKAGYVAIYKKKTSEMFVGDNKYAIDGCATFFRRDRFQLVKKYEVEFNKAAQSLAESFTNQVQKKQALNRLLKDNVALIAVLEAVEAGPADGNRRTLICVANTHIHANKDLTDVKLWQVHTLLKGLEKIAASADIPMLVAGDFNSEPGSAAHSLLTKRRVDESSMNAIDPLGFLKEQKLTHSLELASAYSSMYDAAVSNNPQLLKQRQRVDPVHREPLFTNLANTFKGTLDYVLYTTKFLQPTALLELPTEPEILARPEEHLPNAQYSSDHVALLAEFQYTRG